MSTRTFRANWLIPALGIALVGGGYFPMKVYLGLQEGIRSGEQFSAVEDRLLEDCELSRIGQQAQHSGCEATTRSVEELLCEHFASANPRLASANPDARAMVEDVAQYIDRQLSGSRKMAGDGAAGGSGYEVAGHRTAMRSLASK